MSPSARFTSILLTRIRSALSINNSRPCPRAQPRNDYRKLEASAAAFAPLPLGRRGLIGRLREPGRCRVARAGQCRRLPRLERPGVRPALLGGTVAEAQLPV